MLSFFLILMLTSCDAPLRISDTKPKGLGNTMGNLITGGFVTYDNDNIYYMTFEGGDAFLNKLSSTGEKNKISDDFCLFLNVVDGWIYYVSGDDDKIYKIDINGNNREKISDIAANFLCAYDGVLYLIGGDTDKYIGNLYAMNFDGSNLRILSADKVNQLYLYENNIYYIAYYPGERKQFLFMIDLYGNDKQIIVDSKDIHWFCVYDNTIYYKSAAIHKGFEKISIIDKNETIINELTGGFLEEFINVKDNTIFYRDVGYRTFNQINLSDDTIKSVPDRNVNNTVKVDDWTYHTGLYIVENKILFYENEKIFIMNLDGSKIRLL